MRLGPQGRPAGRERRLADAAEPPDGRDTVIAGLEVRVQPPQFAFTADEAHGLARNPDQPVRTGGRREGLRRQQDGPLDLGDVVPRRDSPDVPAGRDGPLPDGLDAALDTAHASPVDTLPMSPPAATDRSPEAVTDPGGGDADGGVEDGSVTGWAGACAPSPVTTEPMLPPAATDRSPDAVTAPPADDRDRRESPSPAAASTAPTTLAI
ncbi:hypothetical protein ACFVZW_15695 [Streptomyces sp. NPDC059567]|uniref:hypothetical protein n=1 Tax=Streptomyces sp. NPDC059567 TaxID=3346867 RepID=UPI00367D13CC